MYSGELDRITALLRDQYDGDADRLAEDVKRAGGFDALSKKLEKQGKR